MASASTRPGGTNPIATAASTTNDTKTLPAQSDEWLVGAEKHPGSWWTDWEQWIAGLNGKVMVAARNPGKRKAKALEDAPGSFARMRLDLVKKSA